MFSDRRFEQVVGGAAAAKRLKADLAGRGWLATAAGSGGDRYSVRRTVGKGADGKGHREQVVAVRAAAFDEIAAPPVGGLRGGGSRRGKFVRLGGQKSRWRPRRNS